MLSLGANCNPTPPRCGVTCPPGQLRVCLNRCVQPATQRGALCVRDPCDSRAPVCADPFVCSPGAVQGLGSCQAPANGLGACDATHLAQSTCPAGTVCRGVAACRIELPPAYRANPPSGICSVPSREGEACDGDARDALNGRATCAPCEPGTFCDRPLSSTLGTCRRACSGAETSPDCPCGDYVCRPNATGATRVCLACVRNGVLGQRPNCNASGTPATCCDALSRCEVGPTEVGACCRPDATECTGHAQCCGDLCNVDGLCERCRPYGGFAGLSRSPDDVTECCQREVDPIGTTVFGADVGPEWSFVLPAPHPPGVLYQFSPALASVPGGQLALSFYQSDGVTNTLFAPWVVGSRTQAATWSPALRLAPDRDASPNSRVIGDYDTTGAVLPEPNSTLPGTFYPPFNIDALHVGVIGYGVPTR